MKTGISLSQNSKVNSFKQIYEETKRKLSLKSGKQNLLTIFQNYNRQIQKILSFGTQNMNINCQNAQKQRISTSSEDSTSAQEIDNPLLIEQPSYMFLRNIWQGKYCTSKLSNYDSQDHIDKINKVVAMMRSRINYMTKKQNYLYQKDQSNHEHIYFNPVFMKIKEEAQKLKMQNQQLFQRNIKEAEYILKIKKEKFQLQTNFQNLKKKYQQMEHNWIQVSKKNICLEQESLGVKQQNSKSKLNSFRQSTDFNLCKSLDFKSLSFKKLHDESQLSESIRQTDQNKNLNSLENVFIGVDLKKSIQIKNTHKSTNLNSDNQQVDYLKDITNNKQSQHTIKLNSENSPLKFKYIKYEGSGRKALLLSARSVDLTEKTSIAKPKFERTKPTIQNLLKSLGKDEIISNEYNLGEKSSLRKRYILPGQSSLFSNCKSPRYKREEIK